MSLVFLQNQSIIPLLHTGKLNIVSLPDNVSLSLVILAEKLYVQWMRVAIVSDMA